MTLSEKDKLNQKLKIVHWLESLRWADEGKIKENFKKSFFYNKSFFLDEKDSKKRAESILLTHYLVYICDRQMDYRYIFKAGGYTVSWLVEDFLTNRENITKDRNNINDKIKELFSRHSDIIHNNDKYSYFLCADLDENADENIKSFFKNYNENKQVNYKDEVRFSSRFMVIDILCMYKTLLKLCEDYRGSFEEFLKEAVSGDKPLSTLAENFHKLTYGGVPRLEGDKENIVDLLTEFDEKKTQGKKLANHNAKRIWCLARDFIYHPVFSECFKTLVGDKKFKECENNVASLELPGDVWNNNLTFAKCFWLNDKGADIEEEIVKDIKKSSKYVRKRYNEMYPPENSCNSATPWIPKDFDITFNFVPKMCSQDKCSNCPLNNEEKALKDILGEFCHEQKDKLCSFALYATDIEHKCPGKGKCELIKIMKGTK